LFFIISTMLSRKKADQFMQLAEFKAELFSKDNSTKVCAIIVAPESLQELSSGWNGMPRGIDESLLERSVRPEKYLWYEHAERNAIYNASRDGTPLKGSIMVVNRYPCADCARAIIQCGIRSVITNTPESNTTWNESWRVSSIMLGEAGIRVNNCELKDIVLPN
jgi:dCMP deaminase